MIVIMTIGLWSGQKINVIYKKMIKVLTKYIIEGEPRKEKKMNEYGVSGYFYDGFNSHAPRGA